MYTTYNKYKFKLMDGDNLVEEKSNAGNKVTFSDINNLSAGTKNYKIIDEDLYSKVESKLEEEKEQKKTKNKKNREVR